MTNLNDVLLEKLKDRLEGKCNTRGLIKENSIEMLSRSCGSLYATNFKGDLHFNVKIAYRVCNPQEGSIIRCRVYNFNKAGILAGLGTTLTDSPIMILIPRHHHVDQELFHKINIGDTVNVEIIGKKFELNDNQIRIIALLKDDKDKSQTGGTPLSGGEKQVSVIDLQNQETLSFMINNAMTDEIDMDTISNEKVKNIITTLKTQYSASDWNFLESETKQELVSKMIKKLDDVDDDTGNGQFGGEDNSGDDGIDDEEDDDDDDDDDEEEDSDNTDDDEDDDSEDDSEED